MSVYQKNYHPEFIKELPVDFIKIKNMDLNHIPNDYHVLFTTDWNWGRWSKMPMSERIILHRLYLEYQHLELSSSIESKKPKQEETFLGFPKD
jgi:hypothetical protein